MLTTQLGARGPVVSRAGLGTWGLSGLHWGPTDDCASKLAIHAALDAGVTFLDTSDNYGCGHAEELIAEVLAERPATDRERIVIATKCGSDFYNASAADDQGYGPIRPNYAKSYLISACEKSLKRLRVESVAILQLHSPLTPILEQDEPWEALAQLKRDGKIRHAGWSVASFLETEQAHLVERHAGLLDVIQVRYNLLEREAERVLFPAALRHGVGVIVRIPLLFGLLTGKFHADSRFGADDHRHMNLSPEKLAGYLTQLGDLEALFAAHPNETRSQVALRFCISHPACQTVIPGARTPEQAAQNSRAGALGPLPAESLRLAGSV